MYVLKNEKEKNRLGISVSKKVGNSVVRHRITRLIREAYRLNEAKFCRGSDIVVIARNPLRGRGYAVVEESILKLADRHRIRTEESKNETSVYSVD